MYKGLLLIVTGARCGMLYPKHFPSVRNAILSISAQPIREAETRRVSFVDALQEILPSGIEQTEAAVQELSFKTCRACVRL